LLALLERLDSISESRMVPDQSKEHVKAIYQATNLFWLVVGSFKSVCCLVECFISAIERSTGYVFRERLPSTTPTAQDIISLYITAELQTNA
jgi:hypothetical protein